MRTTVVATRTCGCPLGTGQTHTPVCTGDRPGAYARVHQVALPPQHAQHLPRVGLVVGFSKNLARQLDHRIAAEHHARLDPAGHIGRFGVSKPGCQLGGGAGRRHRRFYSIVRKNHLENIPGLGQKLAPPRRLAGQDQSGGLSDHLVALHLVLRAERRAHRSPYPSFRRTARSGPTVWSAAWALRLPAPWLFGPARTAVGPRFHERPRPGHPL